MYITSSYYAICVCQKLNSSMECDVQSSGGKFITNTCSYIKKRRMHFFTCNSSQLCSRSTPDHIHDIASQTVASQKRTNKQSASYWW